MASQTHLFYYAIPSSWSGPPDRPLESLKAITSCQDLSFDPQNWAKGPCKCLSYPQCKKNHDFALLQHDFLILPMGDEDREKLCTWQPR